MGFRRPLSFPAERHSPASTELRLRTLLADIEYRAREGLDGLGSSREALVEVERLAESARRIR